MVVRMAVAVRALVFVVMPMVVVMRTVVVVMVVYGLFRIFVLGDHLTAPSANLTFTAEHSDLGKFAFGYLLLRTFSSGCAALTGVASQIQGNVVKAIAIASPARSAIVPNVPTTTEAGLPEFQISAWNALFAPKGLPPDIQSQLNRALIATNADPTTRQRLVDIGAELPAAEQLTPQALKELVERETARWPSILKGAEVK